MKKLLIILLMLPLSLFAQKQKEMIVGLNLEPPFVMKEGGKYVGLSIDLFEHYAQVNGIKDYSYKEYSTIDDMLEAVEEKKVSLGVSSITITGDRCERVSFSQPYFTSTISLAYDHTQNSSWSYFLSYFNANTLLYIVYLFIFLYVVGAILWFIERKENELFESSHFGIWDGFYYATIIFTTVGFGDITPKTRAGKIVTIIYALICMGVGAILVGNISSSITVEKLESEINIENLNKKKVGTVKGGYVTQFLDKKDIRYINYNNAEECLNAIENGELEVFVYDTPTLQYLIEKENLGDVISLSEETYEPQYYGFAHSKDSDIDNELSPVIIEFIAGDKWDHLLNQYNLENK